jgi:hypothetical protein
LSQPQGFEQLACSLSFSQPLQLPQYNGQQHFIKNFAPETSADEAMYPLTEFKVYP